MSADCMEADISFVTCPCCGGAIVGLQDASVIVIVQKEGARLGRMSFGGKLVCKRSIFNVRVHFCHAVYAENSLGRTSCKYGDIVGSRPVDKSGAVETATNVREGKIADQPVGNAI